MLSCTRALSRPNSSARPQPRIYEDGNTQAHQILRYADRRAASPAESWLRLRLIDAGFGQPSLQVRVNGPRRDYLLDVAYPDRPVDGRRLGLEYDSDQWHSGPSAEARDESRRTELEALGWHIIPVRRPDLWGSYPALELAVGAFLCASTHGSPGDGERAAWSAGIRTSACRD